MDFISSPRLVLMKPVFTTTVSPARSGAVKDSSSNTHST